MVELCPNGSNIKLNKGNVKDYVQLYLEKYSLEDFEVFRILMDGVRYKCGYHMMKFMTPELAAKRASSSSIIPFAALKASIHIYGMRGASEKVKKTVEWFW